MHFVFSVKKCRIGLDSIGWDCVSEVWKINWVTIELFWENEADSFGTFCFSKTFVNACDHLIAIVLGVRMGQIIR